MLAFQYTLVLSSPSRVFAPLVCRWWWIRGRLVSLWYDFLTYMAAVLLIFLGAPGPSAWQGTAMSRLVVKSLFRWVCLLERLTLSSLHGVGLGKPPWVGVVFNRACGESGRVTFMLSPCRAVGGTSGRPVTRQRRKIEQQGHCLLTSPVQNPSQNLKAPGGADGSLNQPLVSFPSFCSMLVFPSWLFFCCLGVEGVGLTHQR